MELHWYRRVIKYIIQSRQWGGFRNVCAGEVPVSFTNPADAVGCFWVFWELGRFLSSSTRCWVGLWQRQKPTDVCFLSSRDLLISRSNLRCCVLGFFEGNFTPSEMHFFSQSTQQCNPSHGPWPVLGGFWVSSYTFLYISSWNQNGFVLRLKSTHLLTGKKDNCVCSEKGDLKRHVSATPSKYIIIFCQQFV